MLCFIETQKIYFRKEYRLQAIFHIARQVLIGVLILKDFNDYLEILVNNRYKLDDKLRE